jgi:hypothetical protein
LKAVPGGRRSSLHPPHQLRLVVLFFSSFLLFL